MICTPNQMYSHLFIYLSFHEAFYTCISLYLSMYLSIVKLSHVLSLSWKLDMMKTWKNTEDLGEDEDSLRYLPATCYILLLFIAT